jgi:membrane-bound lytic murein transglycosylase D
LAVAALAVALLCPVGAWADDATDSTAPPKSDSTAAIPSSPVTVARAAYQNAWAQRQAGDFATSVEVAETGLKQVQEALDQNPDMTTRCALTELKAKLAGLRDAAKHDQESSASAKASGNEPDEKVLNTPATENIELQVNQDVLRWVEYFSGAGRSAFERWLKRSGRYVDLFRAALQKEGLPSDLAQLVFVESGFNVNARSRSAAVGPWQFLRSTGRLFGLTVDQWVDERKDPEKSTVAAARYLKHLYSIFGDWPLALASYNAGEGTVLRAIRRQGTTNYWDLRLPREAEEYVPQFMAVLAISRDPKSYGFETVDLDEPMEFDEVAFKGAIDIRSLAKLAGCTVEELRQLNPQILRHAVRGRDGVTTLRVPRGKGETLLQRLQEGADLPAVDLTLKHRVRRGETLQRIANHYRVSARRLALANGIGRKRPLRRGMVLTVPASLSSPPPKILEAGDPRASTAYVPQRRLRPVTTLGAKSTAEGRVTVTVKKGETLATIAERYGVSSADIMRWNHLKNSRVRRGMRLKIRTEGAALVETSPADSAKIAQLDLPKARSSKHRARRGHATKSSHAKVVVVRSGDTLAEIARRHGVSVVALRRANGLKSSSVRSGQRLKLPNG